MTTGAEYFQHLKEPLLAIVDVVALRRYGTVPDYADRRADLLFRLAESLDGWRPQPGYDSVGYFLRYVLGQILGWGSHDAVAAADERSVVFTDLAPETMEWLEDQVSLHDHQVRSDEALWQVRIDGKTLYLTTPQVIERYTSAMGIEEFSPDRRVAMLAWLDEHERVDMPRPTRLPVTSGDLGKSTITISKGGEITTKSVDLRAATEKAAKGPVPWVSLQLGELPDTHGERYNREADFDFMRVPEVHALVEQLRGLPVKMILEALGHEAQDTLGKAFVAIERLRGGDEYLDNVLYRQIPQLVIEIVGRPNNLLIGVLRDAFGVPSSVFNSYNPPEEEIDLETLTRRIMDWVRRVGATRTKTGHRSIPSIWPSQAESIKMALHGASLHSIQRAEKNYFQRKRVNVVQ